MTEFNLLHSMLFFLHSTKVDCIGAGTFISVKHGGSEHFFLLTCIHIFLLEHERIKRKVLTDLEDKLMVRLKEVQFHPNDILDLLKPFLNNDTLDQLKLVKTPKLLTAEEVLLDSKNPVFCLDQVLTTV